MSVFHNSMLLSPSGAADFDTTLIPNSAWLDGANDFLDSRSFSAQTDPTCFTFATWVQRNKFASSQYLWSAEGDGGEYASINIDGDDALVAFSGSAVFTTTQLFRDIGWYHIICSYKGAANTVLMFVNGIAVSNTKGSGNLASDLLPVDGAHTQRVGAYFTGATGAGRVPLNSYLAQTVFLDGHSIQDSDVAVTDFLDSFAYGTNGSQFAPKADADIAALATTAGGNSFCLDFANSTNLGRSINSIDNNVGSGIVMPGTSGTNIGNMTQNGGLAAAFDDTHHTSSGNSANKGGGTQAFVGKNWSGRSTIIDSVSIFPPDTYTGKFFRGSSEGQLRLYGGNSAPSSGTDGTLLADSGVIDTTGFSSSSAFSFSSSDITTTTAFTYHWMTLTDTVVQDIYVAQLDWTATKVFNDFTPTSMAAANQSTHTPSRTYMQLNALSFFGVAALSEGNTRVGVDVYDAIRGTKFASSGKKYLEVTINTVNNTYIGVANNSAAPTSFSSLNVACLQKGGDIYINAAIPAGTNGSSHAFVDDDVVGILIDADNKKFWQSINGQINSLDRTPDIDLSDSDVIAGTGGFDLTSLAGDDGFYTIHIGNSDGSTADVSVNTGHKAFAHTPPEGYTDWGSDNYTAPEFQGTDYFNAVIYEGTGSEQTIGTGETGSKYTALAWIKNRDAADDNIWMDRVIGTAGYLSTTQDDSGTAATAHGDGGSDILTAEAQAVTAFGQRAVTIGTMNEVNTSGESYVLWQWLIGDSATSAASISTGSPSLSTTGLVADSKQFSIVQYTGNATDNATFAHGLGATPDLVMIKRRSGTATNSDWVLHVVGLGTENYIYPHYRIKLATGAGANGLVPGTDLVEISTGVATNKVGETMMAYCFRNMPGVFRVGTYIGNGSTDGAYVSTGFRPKFVWIFNTTLTSAAAERPIIDTARYGFNGATTAGGANGGVVFSDQRAAEEAMNTSLAVNPAIDILADGFKLRANDSTVNTATTYLYICQADIGGNGTLPPIYGR